jgi:molybdopterin/thiamine biosynthesis adenylyltransferase
LNPSTEVQPLERDVRQRSLVPPERLAACHALVVGVGAIGRQVALQLAALGVPRLTMFDHDSVGTENLAPQGYGVEDLGQPKVHATAAACRRCNPEMDLTSVAERFRRSTARSLDRGPWVVFACVDSIATRRLVWEALHERVVCFLDGRMSAEVVRVLAAGEPALDRYYPTTLFTAEEAFVGACTARSTIYTASIAAGLMVGQFTRWLRRLPVDPDLTLNLLASELTVADRNRC